MHRFGQVAGMQSVVGRPSNRPCAEHIHGQANHQPPRRRFDASGKAFLFERRFHAIRPIARAQTDCKLNCGTTQCFHPDLPNNSKPNSEI